MTDMFGYIYLRSHESYDEYDSYKLGRATNMLDRGNVYMTGEIKRGKFEFVIRLLQGSEKFIEKLF